MLRSKIIKRSLKAILFVSIFIVLMILLDASFELDEAATEAMLTRYSLTEDIDTIFVGNSAGEMLDEEIYSNHTGSNAFNMCTPSQGLSVSLKNMKLACSQHRIKKIVLLMTLDVVNSDDYDGVDHLYDRVIRSTCPFHKRIIIAIKQDFIKSFSPTVVNTEKSINFFIPWENETIHGFSNIKDNLSRRFMRLINGRPLGCDIAYDLTTEIYEIDPGNLTTEDLSLLNDDAQMISDLPVHPDMLSYDKLSLLSQMCTFCRDNDIEFVVIVTPHRSDYYDRFDSFRKESEAVSTYLHDFISKRSFIYYNTEDDPDLHATLPDDLFYDWEHISSEYEDRATNYLTEVLSWMNY